MKYFSTIPNIYYTLDEENRDIKETKNIFSRISFLKEVLKNSDIYYNYDMKDRDKAEIIADKLYEDPERHWIVLLANEIYDPYYDQPLDNQSFDKYIIKKYGSIETAMTQIHHYEKRIVATSSLNGFSESNTYITDLKERSYDVETKTIVTNTLPILNNPVLLISESDSVTIDGVVINTKTYHVVVTSYDYEISENEKKRTIRLPRKETINRIETEYSRLMAQ